jgi:hypothetical protein
MCVKNYTKTFYAVMMTSPKLASPIVIQTFPFFPKPEEVQKVGMPHIEKNREWSLLVHFDEQPQLHVVPFEMPVTPDWRDMVEPPPFKSKVPLLPAPKKVPYLT